MRRRERVHGESAHLRRPGRPRRVRAGGSAFDPAERGAGAQREAARAARSARGRPPPAGCGDFSHFRARVAPWPGPADRLPGDERSREGDPPSRGPAGREAAGQGEGAQEGEGRRAGAGPKDAAGYELTRERERARERVSLPPFTFRFTFTFVRVYSNILSTGTTSTSPGPLAPNDVRLTARSVSRSAAGFCGTFPCASF